MQSGGGSWRFSPSLQQSAIGLMLLLSLGALVLLALWLRNFSFGNRNFQATFLFPNAGGMTVGTRVAYRGVRIGKVTSITPEPNAVAIQVEISPSDRLIPSNVLIEAIQSGLVGETSIDITPLQPLPVGSAIANPLDQDCDPTIIICNGSRLDGQGKLDVNTLIRSMLKIANLLGDPELIASLRSIAQKSSTALTRISALSTEATTLLEEAKRTGSVSTLNSALRSLDRAATDISGFSNEANGLISELKGSGGIQNLNSTLATANTTLNSVGEAANEISGFLAVNQDRLTGTLDSITLTSNQLRTTVTRLDPVLSELNGSEIIANLNRISNNAAELTENLNNLSTQLNDPQTILKLQQILDSARVVFENVQKITSDVDEITGNPELRRELMRLIFGLSNLVSSTQQLHQEVQYAQILSALAAQMSAIEPPPAVPQSQPQPNPEQTAPQPE